MKIFLKALKEDFYRIQQKIKKILKARLKRMKPKSKIS
jgi:hypothetical protein